MIEQSLRVRVEGHLLHRVVLEPAKGVRLRAHALFYHGQGDYGERYREILHPFTDRGIKVIITELPGHGRSPGRRGHSGDRELLDEVIRDSLASFGSGQDLPHGVMGHSMGGLLAARHLVLAGAGKLPVPEFAWLSSPLLFPAYGKSDFFLKLIRFFAPLVPALTVSTGVKPEMCRVKPDPENEARSDREAPPLWHNRISVGWGKALLDFSDLLHRGCKGMPQEVKLLFTQGSEDPVCPSEPAREFFNKLVIKDKHYCELEGLLHEPFRGEGSHALYSAVENWLDALVGMPIAE